MKRSTSPRVFYGWVIVGASIIVLTITGGSSYSFGVFFKPLIAEFGWTRATTSLARSLYQAIHGLTHPIVGLISDRWGSRIPIVVCGVGTGLGFVLMSRVTELWQLYVYYGVIISVFSSFAWVPLSSLVSRWFTARRGLVLGIAATGVGMGSVVMAPLAQALISSFDWRFSYVAFGIIAFAITPLAILLRSPRAKTNGPVRQAAPTEDGPEVPTRPSYSVAQALRTRAFWLLGIIHFFDLICTQMVMVHIVPHVSDQGMAPMPASTVLSLIGVASLAGRVSLGFMSDRIGGKQSLLAGLVMTLVAMAPLIWVKQVWFFHVFAIVFGVGYGGLVPLFPAVIGDYFGHKHQGAIFGLNIVFACFGGALGPYLAGYVYDTTGEYKLAFLLAAAAVLISILLGLAVKAPRLTKGTGMAS